MTARVKSDAGPATGQIRPSAVLWLELSRAEIEALSTAAGWDVAADPNVLAVISDIVRSLVASEIASEMLPRSRRVSRALRDAAETTDDTNLRKFALLDMPAGITSGDPNEQAAIVFRRGPELEVDGIKSARAYLQKQAAALEAVATSNKRASVYPVEAMRCFSWPFRMSNPEKKYSLPSKPDDCGSKRWAFALFAAGLLRVAANRVPAAAAAAGIRPPGRVKYAAMVSLQEEGVPAWQFVRELQKADAKNRWRKFRRTARPISVV